MIYLLIILLSIYIFILYIYIIRIFKSNKSFSTSYNAGEDINELLLNITNAKNTKQQNLPVALNLQDVIIGINILKMQKGEILKIRPVFDKKYEIFSTVSISLLFCFTLFYINIFHFYFIEYNESI